MDPKDLREQFEDQVSGLVQTIELIQLQLQHVDPAEARRYDAYCKAQLEPEGFALFLPTDSLVLQVREMLDALDDEPDEDEDEEVF